jgi:deoxyribodipyrimidine photo-lyase
MQKLGIYWFGQDLRINDNLGLKTAAMEADQLLCIAFIQPKTRNPNHPIPVNLAPVRLKYLRQCLVNLDHNLKQYGQYLHISEDSPLAVLITMIRQFGITHLYLSDDGDFTRQPTLKTLLKEFPSLIIKQAGDNRLFSKNTLPFPVSELPSTFSKFRRKVEHLKTQVTTPAVDRLPAPIFRPEPRRNNFAANSESRQNQLCGGETEGLRHLKNYFSGDYASTYKLTRNSLDGFYDSTKFSPWLANGCITVRQIMEKLRHYEATVESNESTYWIFFELLWREYFQWYAKCYKEKLFSFGGIREANPKTSFYPERFKKWCHGNTPYPIVNACIKQLNATGYMSNRGRQLVASCLVNELALDWRYGAVYMEQNLIDYDMASNWGNWQYLAGVGADPRGLRHFDLDKQTRCYDPEQQFIREWQGVQNITELDSVDPADWPVQTQSSTI